MSNHNRRSVSKSLVGSIATRSSPETRELLALGRQQGWNFAVLGQAPMLDKPVRFGDWLLIPAHKDTSDVPARALERVQAIFAAGLRPQGFVMVHEAPKLLPPPAGYEPPAPAPLTLRMPVLPEQVRSTVKVVSGAIAALGMGLAAIMGVVVVAIAAIAAAAVVLIPLAFVAAIVAVDPILVAVTEDGYWIEIDRWDVEV